MQIRQITVGKSLQVCQIGMPEYWEKLSITDDLGESENVQQAIDKLHELVDLSLKKNIPDNSVPDFTPVVKKETFATLKAELNVTPK